MVAEGSARAARPAVVLTLTVLVPFGVGYYLSYLFRTVNAIISPQLARDVGLSPGDLGLMTSAYFVAFAAAQLPLGVVLDRYGPKRVQAALVLLAAVGAAVFALGTDALTLVVGRVLIGLGMSGCLMAALKANVSWFRRERLPLVNGVIFACGTVGALSTTVPLEVLVQTADWRTVFWGLAGLSVLSGLLTRLLVPDDRPPSGAAPPPVRQFAELGLVYGSGFFWRLACMVFLHNGVFLSYQALWAAPWLRDVAGLDRAGVADAMMMFNAGMLAGVLTVGALAERLHRAGVPPVVPATVGIVVSIAVQSAFALQWTAFPALMCLAFGYFGSASTLAYSVLSQHFPAALAGRVNTAQNMLTFVAAFGIQWLVGVVIGLYPAPGGGLYSADGHSAALAILILLELCGLGFFLWPRRPRRP